MDRNRRLAEMMGLCKHRGIWGGQGWVCYKCQEHIRLQNSHGELDPDFSLPEWRARLMDWAVEQEWWPEFYVWAYNEVWLKKTKVGDGVHHVQYVWRNLPSLLVEYHGEVR